MSLINDMLRDLGQQQDGIRVAGDTQQLLQDSGFTREGRINWWPSVFVFIIALVLVSVWLMSDDEGKQVKHEQPAFTSKTDNQGEVIKTSSGALSASPLESRAEVQEPVPVSISETTSIAASVTNPEKNIEKNPEITADSAMRQQLIDAWLNLAATALAQDRLTSPQETSAYSFYQRILSLAPEHPQAIRGLENIVERYLQLAREASQQQPERAQTLLQRARTVMPDSVAVEQLAQQIAANKVELERSVPAQVSYSLPESDNSHSEPSNSELSKSEHSNSTFSEPDRSTRITSAPLVETQTNFQVTLNREWQDQQAVEQARMLMQQGALSAAQAQLEKFVQTGAATLASQLLVQIYLEQGEFARAAELIAHANVHQWQPTDRVRLQAQWFIAQEDHAGAVTLLEQHLADAQDDERYRALLASLYRTTGKYHEAVASYRRLLENFGESSGYWLGLALSLDILGQKHSALEAFQRARNFQPLQAEVNLYIEQRIAALTR